MACYPTKAATDDLREIRCCLFFAGRLVFSILPVENLSRLTMRAKFALLLLLLPVAAFSQEPVEYDISFDNALHHEARVTVTWRGIGDAPLQIRMSRSSPGRYAIHEFGKNIYNVWVVNGQGEPLEFTRPDPYQWDVAGHDGTVSVTYTLYADRAGGTYSGIDVTHAHLNMPATFMWARGYDDHPISVTFIPIDARWKIATQLVPTDDHYVFTAPNLQYFMDSPTELSDFSLREWQVSSAGTTQNIRLAVHHDGTEADVDKYLGMAKKIVAEHMKTFGELPDFDYGTYTFIADYLPYVAGDGMEHRNSTILASTQSFVDAEFGQLGTLSHEFVHAWNVERIRPKGLEPFDFERANMSDSLWFAEGFTSYYGELAIRRAGESTVEEFNEAMAYWIDTVTNSPGRSFAGPPGMSMQAPFVDAASAIDPTNFSNTFISYYTYGAAVAVALDLEIRERFDDLTLDSLMQRMWQAHGKTEISYSIEDIRQALLEVTDSRRFVDDFFTRYINGRELPDYKGLLENAGLTLRKANSGATTAGPVVLEFEGKAANIAENTIIGTPLYDAGLDRGDQIIAIDRLKITSEERWDSALGRYEPGDSATIQFIQRGVERSAALVFDEDPALEISSNTDASEEQLAFRNSWLGPETE
jgi:predicted metalloprotease with PDZ domain